MKLTEVLEKVVYWTNIIDTAIKQEEPATLSKAMLKLAVYNSHLADHLASLERTANDKRLLSYKAARDIDVTQGDAENLSKLESSKEKELYEKCRYKYKATENLLSASQSRIRVIENQMRREVDNV